MNKDEVAGAIRETGGKIRKKVNKAIGSNKGAALGLKDEVAGNAQKNYGKLKDPLS
ncbi:MAG: hypothetical protein SFT92_06375 [Rickettsiales bacterium]|nr:hypothetical protein [Rickettsiales bacterium]